GVASADPDLRRVEVDVDRLLERDTQDRAHVPEGGDEPGAAERALAPLFEERAGGFERARLELRRRVRRRERAGRFERRGERAVQEVAALARADGVAHRVFARCAEHVHEAEESAAQRALERRHGDGALVGGRHVRFERADRARVGTRGGARYGIEALALDFYFGAPPRGRTGNRQRASAPSAGRERRGGLAPERSAPCREPQGKAARTEGA